MYNVKKYSDEEFECGWIFTSYEEAKVFYDNIIHEYMKKDYAHYTKFYLNRVEDVREKGIKRTSIAGAGKRVSK